jgi:F-type H+-transporting ATPase subunit a
VLSLAEMGSMDWMVHHLTKVDPLPGLAGKLGMSKHALGVFVVGGLLLLTFLPFGRALERDYVPRGRITNLLELILLFIRDEVSRPFLGKEGDKFLPVLWTFFFFILYSNLLGLFPFLPAKVMHHGEAAWSWSTVTPTGSPLVTGCLALIAFLWWHGHGIREQGLIAYLKNIVPGGIPPLLIPMMLVIEIISHIIKPGALMIRLAANMMGGHAILYAMLGMIFLFGTGWVGILTVPAAIAVYFLELFVAFLQAYVFTFLVTVFLGAAVHPDH